MAIKLGISSKRKKKYLKNYVAFIKLTLPWSHHHASTLPRLLYNFSHDTSIKVMFTKYFFSAKPCL